MADPLAAVAISPRHDALAEEHFRSDRFQRKLDAATASVRLALIVAAKPYVAISGGKDSLCVSALVESVARDAVAHHWTDDELEYPEVVAWTTLAQRAGGGDFYVTLGRSEHAGWFVPWTDKPYWRDPLPGARRKTTYADAWMAYRGHDLTLLGTRAGESRKRRDWLYRVRAEQGAGMVYPVKGGTGLRCCPIWDWTEDDVWALIHGWGLPYCAAYDVLADIGVSRERQRLGPLPLTPRQTLADGWPDTLDRLEQRYGRRWA